MKKLFNGLVWLGLILVTSIASFMSTTLGCIIIALFLYSIYTKHKTSSKLPDGEQKASQHRSIVLCGVAVLICGYMAFFAETTPPEKAFQEKLTRDAGLSPVAASALEPVLRNDMRFSSSFTLKHDEMLDGYKDNPKTKGYRGSDDGIKNVIVYITDDKITAIRHDDYDMLVDEKAVLGKYDFVIEKESDLLTFAREDVKRFLKYPDSAEFGGYSDWKAAKNPKEIIVQSWVKSKNGFGNTIRQNFQLKYTPDGKKLTSVIIGNQRCL